MYPTLYNKTNMKLYKYNLFVNLVYYSASERGPYELWVNVQINTSVVSSESFQVMPVPYRVAESLGSFLEHVR